MFTHQINDKLSFKLPTIADATDLLALIDADRGPLGKWLPWAKDSFSINDEIDFIQNGRQEMAADSFWFAIIQVDGQAAGMVDLHNISQEHHRCEIGYWLANQFQGQGIMTAAIRELEAIAFNELHMNRLEIFADAENEKSRAIATRRGFKLEGILNQYVNYSDQFRDMALYAKLRN